jgi:uncharacterized protein YggU (UPF0235/DUF167 family)
VAAVNVRVTPRGAADRIRVTRDGQLAVVVTRPAVDGAATEAARRLLARALKVPLSAVRLAAGARSRLKRFEVTGLDDSELARRIRSLPAD